MGRDGPTTLLRAAIGAVIFSPMVDAFSRDSLWLLPRNGGPGRAAGVAVAPATGPGGTAATASDSGNTDTNHNNTPSDDDDDDDYDVLASLFGSPEARDGFFANDFGTNVVHIRRSETGSNNIEDLGLPCIDPSDGSMDMKVLFDTSECIALRKRGSLHYLNKTSTTYEDFCGYIAREKGSAVVPVAEENALMPFRGAIEDAVNDRNSNNGSGGLGLGVSIDVGINVYHSGPGAVALTRHRDRYDVLVLHLDGQKEWEIGVFPEDGDAIADDTDPAAIERVVSWNNATLVPGDLLYIPRGVFHAATTAAGFNSTTHATIALEYD